MQYNTSIDSKLSKLPSDYVTFSFSEEVYWSLYLECLASKSCTTRKKTSNNSDDNPGCGNTFQQMDFRILRREETWEKKEKTHISAVWNSTPLISTGLWSNSTNREELLDKYETSGAPEEEGAEVKLNFFYHCNTGRLGIGHFEAVFGEIFQERNFIFSHAIVWYTYCCLPFRVHMVWKKNQNFIKCVSEHIACCGSSIGTDNSSAESIGWTKDISWDTKLPQNFRIRLILANQFVTKITEWAQPNFFWYADTDIP